MLERCTQQAIQASLACEELFTRFQAAVEQLDSEKDLCKERKKGDGGDMVHCQPQINKAKDVWIPGWV